MSPIELFKVIDTESNLQAFRIAADLDAVLFTAEPPDQYWSNRSGLTWH